MYWTLSPVENGFSNVEEAAEEMLSITIKDMISKKAGWLGNANLIRLMVLSTKSSGLAF